MSERWDSYYSKNRIEVLSKTKEKKKLYYKTNRDRIIGSVRKRYYETNYYTKNKEYIQRRSKKYRENNRMADRARIHRRRAKKKLLISTATFADYVKIINEFNNTCALTGSNNIAIDHFIPLSWGHGGTYYGNLIPLDATLNIKKSNKNPIEFFEEMISDGTLEREAFTRLLVYLADTNGLSITEYISFVSWCDENRRTEFQIKSDGNIHSIDVWKNTMNLNTNMFVC